MALPVSGPLTLVMVQTEFGGVAPIGMNEYYAGGGQVPPGTAGTYGAVPSSGELQMRIFYGTQALPPNTQKAIFGYGTNGGYQASVILSMTNLVSNTGVVSSDTAGVGTARSGLAAAGYSLT